MTTETMREAVARAMDEALRAIESDARLSELTDDEVRALTDAAIRTVLERLRERELVMREDGMVVHEVRGAPNDVWQAMLDAAAREALPEPADSGRGEAFPLCESIGLEWRHLPARSRTGKWCGGGWRCAEPAALSRPR